MLCMCVSNLLCDVRMINYSLKFRCMECTKCSKFSLGNGPDNGCTVVGTAGSSCREGHMVWIRKCKNTNRIYRWEVIKNPGSGDQVRAKGSNMCLSTVENTYLEIRPCDKTSSRQLFKSITNLKKFELRPYHQRNWDIRDAKCLSQMHHRELYKFFSKRRKSRSLARLPFSLF